MRDENAQTVAGRLSRAHLSVRDRLTPQQHRESAWCGFLEPVIMHFFVSCNKQLPLQHAHNSQQQQHNSQQQHCTVISVLRVHSTDSTEHQGRKPTKLQGQTSKVTEAADSCRLEAASFALALDHRQREAALVRLDPHSHLTRLRPDDLLVKRHLRVAQ